MEFDPEAESMYRWLSGAVVPRPIAWVPTCLLYPSDAADEEARGGLGGPPNLK